MYLYTDGGIYIYKHCNFCIHKNRHCHRHADMYHATHLHSDADVYDNNDIYADREFY